MQYQPPSTLNIVYTLIILGIGAFLFTVYYIAACEKRRKQSKEKDLLVEQWINQYAFSSRISYQLKRLYVGLTDADVESALSALKSYFLVALRMPGKRLDMPSRIVDDAWHLFIVETQAYSDFCQTAFGKYLHHHPYGDGAREGSARTVNLPINDPVLKQFQSVTSNEFPAIFRLDAALGIAGGLRYILTDAVETTAGASGDSGFIPGISFGASSGSLAGAVAAGHAGDADGGDGDGGGDGGSGGCGGD